MKSANSIRFKRYLVLIEALIYIQRTVRLLARAIWLVGSGYLVLWGINHFTGWPTDKLLWLLVSLCFGLIPFINIFYPLPNRRSITWNMDRKLNLQEQVSTAWQVVRKPEPWRYR